MTNGEMTNSRRQMEKVTYTPLLLPESQDGGGALQTAAAVDQLGLLPGEATATQANPELAETLSTMDRLASASNADDRLTAAGALARTPTKALTEAVVAIHAAREGALGQAVRDLGALTVRYRSQPAPAVHSGPEDRTLVLSSPVASALRSTVSSGQLRQGVSTTANGAGRLGYALEVPPGVAQRLGPEIATHVLAALDWARAHAADELAALLARPAAVVPAPMRADGWTFVLTGLPFLLGQAARGTVLKGHLTQRNLQPVGLLHLERIVLTPLTVERGELLYSLPLAPKEKVTLSHKEWTLREEEYARFVQDYLQNYSERGVADKNDMAVASSSETEHSKTLSMTKPTTTGAATIADPVDAKTTTTEVTTDRQSQEQSRRDTREITERASSLAVRDQKISFTVNTISGTEDFTSRVFENEHPDKVLTIDYYRRMRRWRNELYRTGLRLTYDVVLPDPGRVLRERWLAVQAIDEQLATAFSFEAPDFAPARSARPRDALSPVIASLDTVASAVDTLHDLARTLGTTLPAAPNSVRALEATKTITEGPLRDDAYVFSVSLPVDRKYKVTALWMGGQLALNGDPEVYVKGEWWSRELVVLADAEFHQQTIPVPDNQPDSITVDFTARKGALGSVRVWADVEPTVAAWREWYGTVCAVLRQAAYARYNERRELLRTQRTALLAELRAGDALTLRRTEREQVMRLVLEWLFPDFVGAGQAYRDAAAKKPDSWQPAMEYGEYIKFVHQAIDWDHALVLLYPYFWDTPENHAAKLLLDHPDPAHREFLRAGAARVVLAIRPGYEEEVVSLLDRGQLGKLAPGSRFLPIIAAVRETEQRYATTLDADLTPNDNGVPVVSHQGVQIGQWYDWTPTSALDIDVVVRPVTVG